MSGDPAADEAWIDEIVRKKTATLRAENERLREALERLASGKRFEQEDNLDYEFSARVEFAYAALNGEAK